VRFEGILGAMDKKVEWGHEALKGPGGGGACRMLQDERW
jgi:hypothetical protein